MRTKSEQLEAVTDRKIKMMVICTLLWVVAFVRYARKEVKQFRSHALPVFFCTMVMFTEFIFARLSDDAVSTSSVAVLCAHYAYCMCLQYIVMQPGVVTCGAITTMQKACELQLQNTMHLLHGGKNACRR
jgi:hypothetical protein